MAELGKLLLGLGAIFVVAGSLFLLAARMHWPLGRLPGDIAWHGKHGAVHLPITTCIVISVALTLIFYLISRLHR